MASPEHARLVETIRGASAGLAEAGGGGMSVEGIRTFMDFGETFFDESEDVECKPVLAGGVPCEWIAPAGADPDPVVLYLHGGVYIGGSIASHRDLSARLARVAGGRTLAVDYRLCPEHRLADGLEDALLAYRWLLVRGVAPERIVIGGDSAGGGLTMRTLLALRDAGDPLPAAGITISPWVDMTGSGESYKTRAVVDPLFGGGFGKADMEALLREGDLGAPEKSPLFAELQGLPPLLVMVGDWEVLLDDSTRLAAKAEAAGVDVTLEVWEEMFHVWPWMASQLPEGREAIARIGAFIKNRIAVRV